MRYLCIMTNFAQNNMGKTIISLYPHGGGISAIPQARRRVFHVWGLRVTSFHECGTAMRDLGGRIVIPHNIIISE